MLPDLTLVLPTPVPQPSGATAEAAPVEGSGDPFATLLTALAQPLAVTPLPAPPRGGQDAASAIPGVLAQPWAGETVAAPVAPLPPEPGPAAAIEIGSDATRATAPRQPGPSPLADGVLAPAAALPEPPGPAPRLREAAAAAPAEATVARPAARSESSGTRLEPATPPPRPEAAPAAVPPLRQDGSIVRHDGAAGPQLEARLDPLAAAARSAPPAGTAGTSAEARPPALQIALQIAHAAPHRIEQMRVQLHPAALGQVEIRLEFGEQGRIRALIAVERPETLEALQRDAQALERSLHDAGLRTDPGALSFSLRREREPWAQGSSRAPGDRAAGGGSGEVDPEPVVWRSGRHLLDVHV